MAQQDPLDAILNRHGLGSQQSDPLDDILSKHGLIEPIQPPSIGGRIMNFLTTPNAPEITNPIMRQKHPYLVEAYERFIRPISSPLGGAMTGFGGTLLKAPGVVGAMAPRILGGVASGVGAYGATQIPGDIQDLYNEGVTPENIFDIAEHAGAAASLPLTTRMALRGPRKPPSAPTPIEFPPNMTGPSLPYDVTPNALRAEQLRMELQQSSRQLPARGETTPTSTRFTPGRFGTTDVETAFTVPFDEAGAAKLQIRRIPKKGEPLGPQHFATPNIAAFTNLPTDMVAERGASIGMPYKYTDPILEKMPWAPVEQIGARIPDPVIRPGVPYGEKPQIDEFGRLFVPPKTPREMPTVIQLSPPNIAENVAKIAAKNKIKPQELRTLTQALPKTDIQQTNAAAEAFNLSRAIMATDLTPVSSSMFRQALPLAHTEAWWNAWDDMAKAWGKEEAYKKIIESITSHPNFKRLTDLGLRITDLTDLTKREEAIASTWAEKFPIVGGVVRRSNRAYTASLDKLRLDVANKLMDDARTLSRTGKYNPDLDPDKNEILAKQIVGYVNNASGRGNLGMFEKNAKGLATALFSPRMLASRVQMIAQIFNPNLNPFVRKQYLKSAATMGSAWATMMGMGKLAGGTTSTDPTNSDFGKIRIGDTRIDPGAGFLQELVYLARMWQGERTSSTTGETTQFGSKWGGPTYRSVTGDFITPKLNPVLSYLWGISGINPDDPFDPRAEAIDRAMPMVLGDLIEISQENPDLFPVVLPASLLGIGTQTYHPRPGGMLRFIR